MIGFRVAVTLFLVGEMIAASVANAADTFNVDGGYGTHQFVVLPRIGDGAFAGSTTIKFRPGKTLITTFGFLGMTYSRRKIVDGR